MCLKLRSKTETQATVQIIGHDVVRSVPWYIKTAGKTNPGLFVHANGGSKNGAAETLHACPRGSNHNNCQWFIEKSTTRKKCAEVLLRMTLSLSLSLSL